MAILRVGCCNTFYGFANIQAYSKKEAQRLSYVPQNQAVQTQILPHINNNFDTAFLLNLHGLYILTAVHSDFYFSFVFIYIPPASP